MRLPISLAFAVALVVSCGCDASSDTPLGSPPGDTAAPSAEGYRAVYSSAGHAPAVDVRFQPLDLSLGQSLRADVGDLSLQSEAAAPGLHRVSLRAAGRQVLRVVGLLDGVVQRALSVHGSETTIPGGTSSIGPTSVHRSVICNDGRCYEFVEYDYDLTDPTGDGSALWTYPGAPATKVDRLRFEVATGSAEARGGRVDLHSPTPITIVR